MRDKRAARFDRDRRPTRLDRWLASAWLISGSPTLMRLLQWRRGR